MDTVGNAYVTGTSACSGSSYDFCTIKYTGGGDLGDWTPPAEMVMCATTEAPQAAPLLSVSPNPFNPRTTIRYDLPEAAQVTLEVFDINGCRVGVGLAPTRLNAGEQSLTFDGSGLPSGIYVYRLTAGELSASGKMVLLK